MIHVHRTDSGMLTFTNEIICNLLDDNLEAARFHHKKWPNPKHGGSNVCGQLINWHTISDLPTSVIEEVRRTHPAVPGAILIYRFICNCASRRPESVKEASAAGKSTT